MEEKVKHIIINDGCGQPRKSTETDQSSIKKTLEKCYVVEAHAELKIAIYIIVSI